MINCIKKINSNKSFKIFHEAISVLWYEKSGLMKSEKKIVDVKRLKAFIIFDVYFLFLQFNIIAAVWNCFYISVIDCVSFFYQWRVHSSDRHKLTIISHQEQKFFNVAVMKYKNFFLCSTSNWSFIKILPRVCKNLYWRYNDFFQIKKII